MTALRWGRRHKPIVASAAAVLIASVIGLTAGIVLIARERKATEIQARAAIERGREAVTRTMQLNQKAEVLRRKNAISHINLASREFLDDNVALADALLAECPTDLRGWEWDYARRLGHSELASWPGSSLGFDVWKVAFAPDGKRLASGSGPWFQPGESATAELVVRSIPDGKEIFASRGGQGCIQAVAFAPDGKRLAYSRAVEGKAVLGVVTVVDLTTKQAAWTIKVEGTNAPCVAYSPDGRTLAIGRGRFNSYALAGDVMLHDAATGREQGPAVAGPPGGVLGLAFAPDSHRLAVSGRDAVLVYELGAAGRPLTLRLEGHTGFVYAIAYSPHGDQIATGGWDNSIRLWDAATGRQIRTLLGHRGFVRALAYSPDGRWLVSSGEDRSVRRWDLTGRHEPAVYHGHNGFVHTVAFAPDGASFASGSLDGTVKVWPAAEPLAQPIMSAGDGWVGRASFAPDGRSIASIHNGEFRVWDARTGEELVRRPATIGLLGETALVHAPTGSLLAAGDRPGEINLWNVKNWTPVRTLRVIDANPARCPATDAIFTGDGKRLASSHGDGAVRIWDVASGSLLLKIQAHAKSIHALALGPDEKSLATAGDDALACVWDVNSGAKVAEFKTHKEGVRDVAFSRDGRLIASCGGAYRGENAEELYLWDSRTGALARRLRGHTAMVTAVAFLPDGKRLVSTSDDRTLKLWDLEHGDELYTLRGHTSGILCLDMSRDGRKLVTGGIDYRARVWSTLSAKGAEAFALAARREAAEHVQTLFNKLLLKSEVLDALRHEPGRPPGQTQASLEIAARCTENANRLKESAWLLLIQPNVGPEAAAHAAHMLEAARGVIEHDPGRESDMLSALGLAYYRANQPARALEALQNLPPDTGDPIDSCVRVLANARLNRRDQAKTALARFETLAVQSEFAHDSVIQNLLTEARIAVARPESR